MQDISELEKSNSLFLLSDKTEEKIHIKPVKEFFEDYIGLIVLDFENFYEKSFDVKNNMQLKMLTTVTEGQDNLILKFETIANPSDFNLISVTPKTKGQFTERQSQIDPDEVTIYRITFFGGHIVDYSNENLDGSIDVV